MNKHAFGVGWHIFTATEIIVWLPQGVDPSGPLPGGSLASCQVRQMQFCPYGIGT